MSSQSIIYEFKSGLRLAYYKKESKAIGLCVSCKVGSNNETIDNNGISHFIEHMMYKSTKNRTSFDIVNELESIGAMTNAFTTKNRTCFYTISLLSDIDVCAEILADMLINHAFTDEDMSQEKKVVLEEISMDEDDNPSVCIDLAVKAFYKDSPIGRTILGPTENIKKFSQHDLNSYMQENYVANNIVITIVGDISFEDAKKLVLKHFEGKFNKKIENKSWDDKLYISTPQYISKFKKIEQSNICMIMPSLNYFDIKNPQLKIADELLGGGMSSRLFQELREKNGLCYSVYSTIGQYAKNGNTYLDIATNIESVEKSIDLMAKVVKNVQKNGFTKEEINKGKKTFASKFAIGSESTVSMMRAVADYALLKNSPYSIDEIIKDYEALSDLDINNIVCECFDLSKASIAYVGPEIKTNLLEIIN